MRNQTTKKTFSTLDLEQAFQEDAAEIIAARSKARIAHQTKSISAAGRIVETAVRTVLRRRLPSKYHVGEGYIVDKNLVASPQCDVILSDDAQFPVLFQDHHGSEWVTYESVYAIGEVKSGYHPVKSPATGTFIPPVDAFVDSLRRLRTSLVRSPRFSPEWKPLQERIEADPQCEQAKRLKVVPQNYLLSFVLFVNSRKMRDDDLLKLYRNSPAEELPSMVCFLDRGLILSAAATPNGMELTLTPGYTPLLSLADTPHHWALHEFGGEGHKEGANLAMLCFLLNRHLSVTTPEQPDLLQYQKKMLQSRMVLDLR